MKRNLLATFACLCAVTVQLHAADPVLCGSAYSTADAAFASGVYEIPVSAGGELKLVGLTQEKATGGGFHADGIYYVSELNNAYSFYGGLTIPPTGLRPAVCICRVRPFSLSWSRDSRSIPWTELSTASARIWIATAFSSINMNLTLRRPS